MPDNGVGDEADCGAGGDAEHVGGGAAGLPTDVAPDGGGGDVGYGAAGVDVVVLADVLPFGVGGAADDELGEAVCM